MRRSVESPNVQCDWADIERQTYQSRPWQSTAAPGISRHFDAAHELSNNQIEADIGGDKRTMIMPKPPSAPSRTERRVHDEISFTDGPAADRSPERNHLSSLRPSARPVMRGPDTTIAGRLAAAARRAAWCLSLYRSSFLQQRR